MGSDGGPGTRDPTRYTFGKADLLILIMIAHHVEDFRVSSPVPLDNAEFGVAAAALSQLAEVLCFAAYRPVVDRTGLYGRYNFMLEFTREVRTPVEGSRIPAAPDLNTALR